MRLGVARALVSGVGFLGVACALALTMSSLSAPRRIPNPPRLCVPAAVGPLEFPATSEEWLGLTAKCSLGSARSLTERLHDWRLLAVYEAVIEQSPSGATTSQLVDAQCRKYEQILGEGMRIPDAPAFERDLLRHAPAGLSVRRKNRERGREVDGEAHAGELLATLAECGVPAERAIWLRGSNFTVRDIVRQRLRRENIARVSSRWIGVLSRAVSGLL